MQDFGAAAEAARNHDLYAYLNKDTYVECPVCGVTFDPDKVVEVLDVDGNPICGICRTDEGFVCIGCGVFYTYAEEGDGPFCDGCGTSIDPVDEMAMENLL